MKQILVIVLAISLVSGLDNGVGLTPPMGWNSWNHFGCYINETIIKTTADLLVRTGLAAKGYKYVNLDDCWQASRDPNTHEIIADKNFPSGMEALGEYIHSKGLKYGLYSDAGYKTCQGRPGSLGYEQIDASTYAKWKVDYLKYDNCNTDGTSPKIRYPVMRDALNKTGRPIYYSMCEWGVENPATWAGPVGNSWRTTGDITDSFSSFTSILDKQVGLDKYAKPGAWNDPDMLEVGNGKMTTNQYQAHFALWAALKAPLLIGCDLSKMTNQTLEILGNEELIAINQDKLGIQANRVKQEIFSTGARDYWAGKLSGGRYVLILFNRESRAADFSISLSRDIGLPAGMFVSLRDVIAHKDIGVYHNDVLSFAQIPSHSVKALVMTVQQTDRQKPSLTTI